MEGAVIEDGVQERLLQRGWLHSLVVGGVAVGVSTLSVGMFRCG